MLDWIGSLRIRHRDANRVELCLTRTTSILGWFIAVISSGLSFALWPISLILAGGPALLAALGLFLATLRRSLVFDRQDGILRIDQQVFGLSSRAAVPLFHLRAVVVAARAEPDQSTIGPRFIAYIERRVGSPIHLDEARRCATLLPLAKAISEVAELRLVYDATARAAMP